MSLVSECYVLSGRGLCIGPIPSPEESYVVWSVQLSVISKLRREGGLSPVGLSSHEGGGTGYKYYLKAYVGFSVKVYINHQ
jgi:hypothetical protein